jgi:hypothetical protein
MNVIRSISSGNRSSGFILPGGKGRTPWPASRSWHSRTVAGAALALLLVTAGSGPAVAETPSNAPAPSPQTVAATSPGITVELNRLETVDKGCRLSFVFTNAMPVAVDGLAIEAVLFDTDGRVDRFLLLKARPLPQGKTRVQQFDVTQASCAGIGRVLLNDVTACAGEGLDASACLEAIRPQSRADIPFTTALSPTGD